MAILSEKLKDRRDRVIAESREHLVTGMLYDVWPICLEVFNEQELDNVGDIVWQFTGKCA